MKSAAFRFLPSARPDVLPRSGSGGCRMSDELRAALAKRSSGNHAPAELLLIDESTELAAMQERRLVKAAFELSGVCTSMIALRSSRRFPDVYPLQVPYHCCHTKLRPVPSPPSLPASKMEILSTHMSADLLFLC